jgi:hypothetical protein
MYIWLHVNTSRYDIKYIIITNSLKCQFGLHHCNGPVETTKMEILFVCIGVRMKSIKRQNNIGH